MTSATLTAPERAPASPPGAPASARSYLVTAETALILLTLATVVGFGRVFADWSFLVPMLAVALYTHGISMFTRRRGYSVPASGLIAVPGFLLLCAWLFFLNRTAFGIPTPSTVSAASEALSASWDAFQNVVAPAPPLPGFVMASCAALFFAIFLADWAAFRLWSAFEAIVPASTLFIFCSLLGSSQLQIAAASVFAAALFWFLLCHRIARQETSAGWLTADIARGSRALATTGIILAVGGVLIGAIVVPRLAFFNQPAMVSLRDQSAGPGSRTTISPLVDIQDRLISQSNVELFTVRSNERSYWRMTSLDTFEGDIWKSSGKYTSAEGDLDAPVPAGVKTATATQNYTIENLRVLWLPAAFEPLHVESPMADVRYQAESSTLIVDTSVADSDGLSYEVTSALPRFTAQQLETAGRSVPKDIADHYLALPGGFSDLATRTAREVTRAAGDDPYQKARLLQDYFRSGEFTYKLDVKRGHSTNAIDDFLQAKEGYCEQYAGTYAAMARAIGLPSRVAVGFTPGELSGSDTYTVRGEHAHAWPEVYLTNFGWVPFEPTPDRGAPGAQDYTGVPERQVESAASAATTVPGSVTTPSTVTTLVPVPGGTALENIDAGGATPTPTSTPAEERGWLATAAIFVGALLLVVIAVGAVYAVVVLLLKEARHERRRSHATTPNAQVGVAWDEAVEALQLLGIDPDPTETRDEFATRAVPVLGGAGAAFLDLARDVDAADYAPDQLDEGIAQHAHEVAASVTGIVHERVGPVRRLLDRLDPRPLLPTRGPGRRSASATQRPALPLP